MNNFSRETLGDNNVSMPWKETHAMDQRMKFILEWNEALESKTELCRCYGKFNAASATNGSSATCATAPPDSPIARALRCITLRNSRRAGRPHSRNPRSAPAIWRAQNSRHTRARTASTTPSRTVNHRRTSSSRRAHPASEKTPPDTTTQPASGTRGRAQ